MFSVALTAIAFGPTLGVKAAPICFGSRDVVSPDGQLFAKVRQIGRTGCGESLIKILNRAGRTLAERSFRSADGEHGAGVEETGWSTDSQYFAFSLSSSGGHQADHFPTFIFSRRGRRILDVEDLSPGTYIAQPHFVFSRGAIEVTGTDGRRVKAHLPSD
ncbi:MAG TPA: hypothetical protein VIJ94_20355 [Caulobacteraceae bacterium]